MTSQQIKVPGIFVASPLWIKVCAISAPAPCKFTMHLPCSSRDFKVIWKLGEDLNTKLMSLLFGSHLSAEGRMPNMLHCKPNAGTCFKLSGITRMLLVSQICNENFHFKAKSSIQFKCNICHTNSQ